MNFDFLHLYEELTEINEAALLIEGNHGAPKKAFLNLVQGLYYTKFNPDPGKRIKQDQKEISNSTIAPVTTKISQAKSAAELASETDVNTTETNIENGEQRDLTSGEVIHKVNKSIAAGQIALFNKKHINPETGEEESLYTVYNKYPSILHHMNAEHNDDAVIRSYTFTDPSSNKKTQTSVFCIEDPKLFNYVLITANTHAQAKYGHMMIHLLAMIIASVGPENTALIDNIIIALDAALANNNKGSTLFTIFTGIEADNYIKEFTNLKQLYETIKDNEN